MPDWQAGADAGQEALQSATCHRAIMYAQEDATAVNCQPAIFGLEPQLSFAQWVQRGGPRQTAVESLAVCPRCLLARLTAKAATVLSNKARASCNVSLYVVCAMTHMTCRGTLVGTAAATAQHAAMQPCTKQ